VAQSTVVPVALTLNVLVATVGWFVYMRRGYFSARLLMPFLVGSIPAAYLGGRIHLSSATFGVLLGIALVCAALRMLVLREVRPSAGIDAGRRRRLWSVAIGAVLGLIAGMVGIGGGIFLSPLLLFLKWADAKQTAAVSSAFIVLNSLSGLAGHLARESVPTGPMVLLGTVVFAGGLVGSFAGARYIRSLHLQIILGAVLFLAGGKLLLPLFVRSGG